MFYYHRCYITRKLQKVVLFDVQVQLISHLKEFRTLRCHWRSPSKIRLSFRYNSYNVHVTEIKISRNTNFSAAHLCDGECRMHGISLLWFLLRFLVLYSISSLFPQDADAVCHTAWLQPLDCFSRSYYLPSSLFKQLIGLEQLPLRISFLI
ncbi:conserved hypothetical protein [Trichinella spiralis]|uniref:Uncharacterized protein n=1 Tax=Trichinella spiralis TaxID=6334 RepID=E5SQF7_TRISP|nr:conserved hypothetical protein [Trichinella spiralis]KRY29534.1 hypothetical protein T01_16041 [Trichinella spiralis]